MNMLKMDKVCAGYGDLKVLFDISLEINEGEVVALVGSNGAGKTTLLRTISGEVIPTSGSIKWLGMELTKLPENKRAVNGIAHIPQGRGILSRTICCLEPTPNARSRAERNSWRTLFKCSQFSKSV